jgi:putative transposase
VKPAGKRRQVEYLVERFRVSRRRVCGLLLLCRATFYYRSHRKDETPIRMRLRELAQIRPRSGYLRLHVLLRREGWKVNKKRTYRIYREEGLSVRTSSGRSGPAICAWCPRRRRSRTSGGRWTSSTAS